MSSEYFTRTSLHLVRLKIFEWIKCLRRHLHQIQGNWAGRNFVTESRVNSRLITHARMHTEMNLKSTTTNGFNFRIILLIKGSWEVRLTWLDSNQRSYIWIFGWTLREGASLSSPDFSWGRGDVCTQAIFIEPTRNLMNNRAFSCIPCGAKVFREFIFAETNFFY